MLGATVMPHAIYVHSALARDRHGPPLDAGWTKTLISATRLDVLCALIVAGAVNVGMLLLAAATLSGVPGTDTIAGAHAALSHALGPAVGMIFAIGLLASGLASSSVGSYAGATIMAGLLHIELPLLVRRLVTLVPALVILAIGGEPTRALVISRVVLSLGIPFALIPLVRFTADRSVMGSHATRMGTRVVAWLIVAVIVALNLVLIVLTAWGWAG